MSSPSSFPSPSSSPSPSTSPSLSPSSSSSRSLSLSYSSSFSPSPSPSTSTATSPSTPRSPSPVPLSQDPQSPSPNSSYPPYLYDRPDPRPDDRLLWLAWRETELLHHSILHRHGTPVMHALASSLQSHLSNDDPVYDPAVSSALFPSLLSDLLSSVDHENGQIPGMCALGRVFQSGVAGVDVDLCRAVQLWQKDIRVYGCNIARYYLANAFEFGTGVQCNPAMAKVLYERVLAEELLPQAAFKLAWMLMSGDKDVSTDRAQAVSWFEWLVEECEDFNAMCPLADLLSNRDFSDVPYDPQRAVELYERASAFGLARATNSLAILVELGYDGTAPDPPRAVRIYEKATQQDGDDTLCAMHNLSLLFRKGDDGVEKDPFKAEQYMHMMSNTGDVYSMWYHAQVVQKGEDGIPVDHFTAVRLYEQLSLQSKTLSASSKSQLAWLLSGNSDQIETDYTRAIMLFEEVLDVKPDLTALLGFASLLEHGHGGIEIDRQRAKELYSSAIHLYDNSDAMIALGSLLCRGRRNDDEYELVCGLEMLERALDTDDISVKRKVANVLTSRDSGPPIDVDRGMKLYEEDIVEHQSMKSMVLLAQLLRAQVYGITPDIPRSMELCERAIAQGLLNNEEKLAKVGIWCDQSCELSNQYVASELRDQAIRDRDYLVAMVNLADTLACRGTEGDYDRALSLFELALRDSRASSTFRKHSFDVYADSLKKIIQNVWEDEALCKKAVEVYELAVGRTGSTQVMCLLAKMFMDGAMGVPSDTKKAVCLYGRAAFNENASAMLILGEMMTVGGPGIRVDRMYAVELFVRIVELGEDRMLSTKAVVNLVLMFQQPRRLKNR